MTENIYGSITLDGIMVNNQMQPAQGDGEKVAQSSTRILFGSKSELTMTKRIRSDESEKHKARKLPCVILFI